MTGHVIQGGDGLLPRVPLCAPLLGWWCWCWCCCCGVVGILVTAAGSQPASPFCVILSRPMHPPAPALTRSPTHCSPPAINPLLLSAAIIVIIIQPSCPLLSLRLHSQPACLCHAHHGIHTYIHAPSQNAVKWPCSARHRPCSRPPPGPKLHAPTALLLEGSMVPSCAPAGRPRSSGMRPDQAAVPPPHQPTPEPPHPPPPFPLAPNAPQHCPMVPCIRHHGLQRAEPLLPCPPCARHEPNKKPSSRARQALSLASHAPPLPHPWCPTPCGPRRALQQPAERSGHHLQRAPDRPLESGQMGVAWGGVVRSACLTAPSTSAQCKLSQHQDGVATAAAAGPGRAKGSWGGRAARATPPSRKFRFGGCFLLAPSSDDAMAM